MVFLAFIHYSKTTMEMALIAEVQALPSSGTVATFIL